MGRLGGRSWATAATPTSCSCTSPPRARRRGRQRRAARRGRGVRGLLARRARTRRSRSTPTCGPRGAAARWCAPSPPTRDTTRWSATWECQALLRAGRWPATRSSGERFVELIDPLRYPAAASERRPCARSGGSRRGSRPSGCRAAPTRRRTPSSGGAGSPTSSGPCSCCSCSTPGGAGAAHDLDAGGAGRAARRRAARPPDGGDAGGRVGAATRGAETRRWSAASPPTSCPVGARAGGGRVGAGLRPRTTRGPASTTTAGSRGTPARWWTRRSRGGVRLVVSGRGAAGQRHSERLGQLEHRTRAVSR